MANSERAPEIGSAWLAAEMQSWPEIRAEPTPEKIDDLAAALTEQRNPRSENLDKMNARDLVKLFIEEEKFVEEALRAIAVDLARAIELVVDSLRKDGRLFYVVRGYKRAAWACSTPAKSRRPLEPHRIWSRESLPVVRRRYIEAWRARRMRRVTGRSRSTVAESKLLML